MQMPVSSGMSARPPAVFASPARPRSVRSGRPPVREAATASMDGPGSRRHREELIADAKRLRESVARMAKLGLDDAAEMTRRARSDRPLAEAALRRLLWRLPDIAREELERGHGGDAGDGAGDGGGDGAGDLEANGDGK